MKKITEEQIPEMIEYAKDHNISEIAEKFNVSYSCIKHNKKKYNFTTSKKSFYITDRNKKIVDYYVNNDVSIKEVADKFNLVSNSIGKVLKQNGIKTRSFSKEVKNILSKYDYKNMTVYELYCIVQKRFDISYKDFRAFIFQQKIDCIKIRSKIAERLYRVNTEEKTIDELLEMCSDLTDDPYYLEATLRRNGLKYLHRKAGRPKGSKNVNR